MIYSHQEILQALYDNPSGLKTDDIRLICMMNVGSELPNDNNCISKLVSDLKRKHGYVESVEYGIHKITEVGIAALNDALKDDCEQENTATQLDNTLDVSGLSELQTGLLSALAAQFLAINKPPVDNLRLKLLTLNHLSELLSDDLKKILSSIADDLQRQ